MFDPANPYYKQVQLLVSIMPFVERQEMFALKGGTAINLFIRDLPRLSVDIDLVYLPVNDRGTALAEIRRGLESIANDISSSGIAVVNPQYNRAKLILSNGKVQVKVEVSLMLRGSLLAAEKKGICSKIEEYIGSTEMLLLNPHEIFAGKLCAALDRQHPRDLFDVKYLLESEGLSSDLMDAFIIYLLSSSRPISELLDPRLKDIKDTFRNHFKGMTTESISCEELEKTRAKMIRQLRANLTESRKQFLFAFKKGEVNWNNSPFPEAKHLPSIRFKLYNLEKMPKKKKLKAIDKLSNLLWN